MSAQVGQMPDSLDPHNFSTRHPDYTANIPSYEDACRSPARFRHVSWTTPEFKPYLGLRSRLSQIWFNRWTLLLFLIVVRVLLATSSLDGDLDNAKDKALSACTGVESMGSAMASMPHYMSKGVNEMAATGVEAAVSAVEKTASLMITAVQEIVVFIINMFVSTYLCLITFAVKGSVGLVVDASREITDFLNGALDKIFDEIADKAEDIEGLINKFADGMTGAVGFFGADIDIPKVDFGNLDELKKIDIPDTFVKKLEEIEKNIPEFKEIKDLGNSLIRKPFQMLNSKINESLSDYTFDRSIFPTPPKEKLTFCSDNPVITDFFTSLKETLTKVKNAILGVLIAAAILAIGPMAYREIRNYKIMRERAKLFQDEYREDPVTVVHLASNPTAGSIGLKLARNCATDRRRNLVQWAIAYISSPPALFVLSLGIAGLAGVLCQFILLKQVESKAPGLAAEIGEFADIVVDKLTSASTAWATDTNTALRASNDELNENIFGWVKEGTDNLNGTLNKVVDTMAATIEDFLGGTVLEKPVKDVLDCLVVFKIQGIQKGLTWVHTNAKVTFPTLPADTFALGASSSLAADAPAGASFLAAPDSAAADQITDVVYKLTAKWAAMLSTEAAISAAIVAIWLLVLLIAIARTLFFWFTPDPVRGLGGSAPDAAPGPTAPVGIAHGFPAHPHGREVSFPEFNGGSPTDGTGTMSTQAGYATREGSPAYPDEKAGGEEVYRVGVVRSGTMEWGAGGGHRKSVHTRMAGHNRVV